MNKQTSRGKEAITVFQDENAIACYILGTDNWEEAEKALREQENVWYGDDESKWDGTLEKRIPADNFSPRTFYIRGEHIAENPEDLPRGKSVGNYAKREGFIAYLD